MLGRVITRMCLASVARSTECSKWRSVHWALRLLFMLKHYEFTVKLEP